MYGGGKVGEWADRTRLAAVLIDKAERASWGFLFCLAPSAAVFCVRPVTTRRPLRAYSTRWDRCPSCVLPPCPVHGFIFTFEDPIFTMLRPSLRQSTSRLLGGSCYHGRSPCTTNILRTVSFLTRAPRNTASVARRRALALTAQNAQKRCYAMAAEDTNKGVVSHW